MDMIPNEIKVSIGRWHVFWPVP